MGLHSTCGWDMGMGTGSGHMEQGMWITALAICTWNKGSGSAQHAAQYSTRACGFGRDCLVPGGVWTEVW